MTVSLGVLDSGRRTAAGKTLEFFSFIVPGVRSVGLVGAAQKECYLLVLPPRTPPPTSFSG